MNRFIGLIIMVVALAALAGAAIGWKFPFLGQSRTANQIETERGSKLGQPANQTQALSANQPTKQAQNTEETTAQAQNTEETTAQAQNPAGNTGTTENTQSAQAESSQPVQALW